MDIEAAKTQMKSFKTKAKAATKAGKADMAVAFKNGAKRLSRKLRAAVRPVKKVKD